MADPGFPQPNYRGEYAAPDGEVYEVHITSAAELSKWWEYAPTVMAVVNSGALDKYIYEIAAVCHARHLATNGEATTARPDRPARATAVVANSTFVTTVARHSGPFATIMVAAVNPHQIVGQDNRLLPVLYATRHYTVNGKRYSKDDLRERYFIGVDTFPVQLQGALFKILSAGTANFTCRILSTLPAGSHSPGDTVKIPFTAVPHLFG